MTNQKVRRSYPWVEGHIIPSWAENAIFDNPCGEKMTVLCEMSKEKQANGWPKFNLAYIDIPIGKVICLNTAENISEHIIRYMPIDDEWSN